MEKAKSDGLHLLKLLNMSQKQHEFISSLSGGMKRKVSLAIALIGNPEVRSIVIIYLVFYYVRANIEYQVTIFFNIFEKYV